MQILLNKRFKRDYYQNNFIFTQFYLKIRQQERDEENLFIIPHIIVPNKHLLLNRDRLAIEFKKFMPKNYLSHLGR